MSSSLRTPQPNRFVTPLDEERQAWDARRGSLATPRDRSVAIAIALRGVRNAHAFTAVFAAIEDTVARYLGAQSFALYQPLDDGWRAVVAHGLDADEVTRRSGDYRSPSSAALAWCPIRGGQQTLGWLAIYRLGYGKQSLDAFDIELVDALGPFVAVAFEEARAHAMKTTVRPPSMTKLRTT
jgi:hypothetical protein